MTYDDIAKRKAPARGQLRLSRLVSAARVNARSAAPGLATAGALLGLAAGYVALAFAGHLKLAVACLFATILAVVALGARVAYRRRRDLEENEALTEAATVHDAKASFDPEVEGATFAAQLRHGSNDPEGRELESQLTRDLRLLPGRDPFKAVTAAIERHGRRAVRKLRNPRAARRARAMAGPTTPDVDPDELNLRERL